MADYLVTQILSEQFEWKKLANNNNNVTLMRRLTENHSKTKIYSSLWMSRLCNSKHREEKQDVFGIISVQLSNITELVSVSSGLWIRGWKQNRQAQVIRCISAAENTVQLHNVALHAKAAGPLAAVPLKHPALIKGPIIPSSLRCVN